MKLFTKTAPSKRVTTPERSASVVQRGMPGASAGRNSRTAGSSALLDETGNDPLSRAQILSSIRAAKRLHLPTGEVLRAIRRQIDED